MSKLNVGVIFGSRSVEHEVSVITAQQVMAALDRSKYDVVPIYVDKKGRWFTGRPLLSLAFFKNIESVQLEEHLTSVVLAPVPRQGRLVRAGWRLRDLFSNIPNSRLDIIIPATHGTCGEDGTLQGLLELADLPYVGSGVLGSAVGMDKIVMKDVFRSNGIPTVKYHWFTRYEWEFDRDQVLDCIQQKLSYPMFVKPSNLGSSVGISKVRDITGLCQAVEIASHYDRRLLVEEGIEDPIEINCSVLGDDKEAIPSICEQPISWSEFLSFEDKYQRDPKFLGMKGANRRIPAPIDGDLTKQIQELACRAFRVIDACGVARVDFLVSQSERVVFVNEINTIPGSFSFYLWELSGIGFGQLLDRLINLALSVYHEKKQRIYTYDTKLLKQAAEATAPKMSSIRPKTPKENRSPS